MTNRIYSFLGLATKAGKLVSGDDTCERMLKSGKAKLVVVAEDASKNTRKSFDGMCKHREIPILYYGEKELLGRYIGKEKRAVVALLDDGFAAKVKELIDNSKKEFGGEEIGEN